MNALGISAWYHDSAAALVRDGHIVAAAQEERFTRRKHDDGFPINAIAYCLRAGGVAPGGIDAVAFYEKPVTKFARLVQTYARISPRGFRPMRAALPLWARQKLWIPYEIEIGLRRLGYRMPERRYYAEHHESHAASAFYPSPFRSAAVVTADAVGEWATTSIGRGDGHELELLQELRFPHSLGLLYSAFTDFCGFRVNSGEYKLMGLAPYGEPRYAGTILDELLDLRDDGSFRLNLRYFGFLAGFAMTNRRFARLFGGPPREPEGEITKREMDLARSVQAVAEEVMLRIVRTAAAVTGERHLCLAGGVALNSVANGRIQREGPFERVWIQPAAGDAGGAVGSALWVWHQVAGNPRTADGMRDGMEAALLGPSFTPAEVAGWLDGHGYPYEALGDDAPARVAGLLADGHVVAVFQGRMEYGPRALGSRSILADPRAPDMQSKLNLRVKQRESFRPFAPAVLAERAGDYFDLDGESPYMLLVTPVRDSIRVPGAADAGAPIREQVAAVRSTIPAVTHVDHSARVQTVARDTNPAFHRILEAFDELTGCPVLVNTSFNVRGEPIVCTPADAYACFMGTGIDYLMIEGMLLDRTKQPDFVARDDWLESLVLD